MELPDGYVQEEASMMNLVYGHLLAVQKLQ